MESYKRNCGILMTGFSGDRISGSLTIPEPRYIKSIKELSCIALQNQMDLLSFKDAVKIIRYANDDTHHETLKEWFMSFSEENFEDYEDYAIFQYIKNRNRKRVRYQINSILKYVQAVYPYSDNDILKSYFSLPLGLINHQKAHCYAGFYRNREYGKYQAVEYPISLSNEYKYPLALYALRLIRNRVNDIHLMSILKKRHKISTGWEYGIIKELGIFEIFNEKYLRELHHKGLLNQHILRKMHTLKIFYDFYCCEKDIDELLLDSLSQQER